MRYLVVCDGIEKSFASEYDALSASFRYRAADGKPATVWLDDGSGTVVVAAY